MNYIDFYIDELCMFATRGSREYTHSMISRAGIFKSETTLVPMCAIIIHDCYTPIENDGLCIGKHFQALFTRVSLDVPHTLLMGLLDGPTPQISKRNGSPYAKWSENM